MSNARLRCALTVALTLATVPAVADELDTKRECAAAHERAQRARMAGRLVDAHAAALSCARDACPAVVRSECATFVTEIESALPTVLFDVRDEAGSSILDADVAVDGVPLAQRLAGRPIPLDPGVHAIRITASDGRVHEERIVALEGETRRRVIVVLPPVAPPTPTPATIATPRAPTTPLPAVTPTEPPPRAPTPWLAYGLGGVGAVALGTFAFFGLRGYRDEIRLESSCAPACAPGSDDAMRRDYLIADVALVTGIVAVAAATYLFVTSPPERPRASR